MISHKNSIKWLVCSKNQSFMKKRKIISLILSIVLSILYFRNQAVVAVVQTDV